MPDSFSVCTQRHNWIWLLRFSCVRENWWVGNSRLKLVLICYQHATSGFYFNFDPSLIDSLKVTSNLYCVDKNHKYFTASISISLILQLYFNWNNKIHSRNVLQNMKEALQFSSSLIVRQNILWKHVKSAFSNYGNHY